MLSEFLMLITYKISTLLQFSNRTSLSLMQKTKTHFNGFPWSQQPNGNRLLCSDTKLHQVTKSCRGHQTWSFQLFQTPKLRKFIIIESLKKLKRSYKIDSNSMRQRWRSKSSELWTNDIGHKILFLFGRHLNVEIGGGGVRACWPTHTQFRPLSIYIQDQTNVEAYLNFQKSYRSWLFQNLQKIRGFHERIDGFLASFLTCCKFFL
jgi:hypothetical protein